MCTRVGLLVVGGGGNGCFFLQVTPRRRLAVTLHPLIFTPQLGFAVIPPSILSEQILLGLPRLEPPLYAPLPRFGGGRWRCPSACSRRRGQSGSRGPS